MDGNASNQACTKTTEFIPQEDFSCSYITGDIQVIPGGSYNFVQVNSLSCYGEGN
jgi:hypothetical protein